jgi:hypothetical protein
MFQNNLLVLTASLKVQFLRCASFRVHCGVQKYASFHEIRDAFLSRWFYVGELELFTLPSQF